MVDGGDRWEPNAYTPPDGIRFDGQGDIWVMNAIWRARRDSKSCSLFGGTANRCGWSPQCAEDGLCSSAGGKCRAKDDADCLQSDGCTKESRCKARGGACVAP